MKKSLKTMYVITVLAILSLSAIFMFRQVALAKVVDGIDTEKIYTIRMELGVWDGNQYMLCMTGDGTGKNDKVKLKTLKNISTHANMYFQFERTSDGYWAIKAAGSKKYIDIEGKSKVANKCLHNYHEKVKADNQKFEIEKLDGDGYYIKIPGTDLVWSLQDKIWDDGVFECDVRTGTKKYRTYIQPIDKDYYARYYDYKVEPWTFHTTYGIYGLTVGLGDKIEKYGEDGKYVLPSVGQVKLDKKALLGNKYNPWTKLFELPVKEVDIQIKEGQNISSITIPEGVERIIKIGGGDGIAAVSIPKSVREIGENAFADNKRLSNIVIPDEVTKLKGTFKNCSKLSDVQLSKKITELGDNTFSGCTSIKNINLPNNKMIIGKNCFSGCTGLEAVIITDKQLFSIQDSAFKKCTSLKNFRLLLTKTKESENGIGYETFAGCENLESISLTTDETIEKFTLGNGIFSDCKKLKEVQIPENTAKIGENAFKNCDSLRELTIPDGITVINKNPFSGCHDLTIKVKSGTDTEKQFQKSYPDGVVTDSDAKNVKIEYVGKQDGTKSDLAAETGSAIGGGSGMMAIIFAIAVVIAGIGGFVIFRKKSS